jgi:hypothetical protein
MTETKPTELIVTSTIFSLVCHFKGRTFLWKNLSSFYLRRKKMSTHRRTSIDAGACSGLTLSGASYPALKAGLRPAEWVNKRKGTFRFLSFSIFH